MKNPSPSCNPHEIATLVRDQDGQAIHRIAECYMGHLLAVGRCACRDDDKAPDAVQEAFVAATEKLSQFRGDGSVKSWMSKMVVNACRCQDRGRKNDPGWNLPLNESTHVPTRMDGPGDIANRSELLREMGQALETLNGQDKELFLLSQLQEISAPELAEIYERSPTAIRAQLTRIRRKLRVELSAIWQDWHTP